MKRFPAKSLLALSMLFAMVTFFACQKDSFNPSELGAQGNPQGTSDRSPNHKTYGVTVYSPGNPSRIVEIDEATGNVTNAFLAFVDPGTGPIMLDDLKGIALTSWGQYFLTTGANNSAVAYNNALMKVNVNLPTAPLGQCSYFFSNCPFGPVSDLEFDPATQNFYGLLNNTNQLIEISNFGTNWTTYSPPIAITGVALGTTMQGLSLVRDGLGQYLVGCANRPGNPFVGTTLYSVPFTGGLANFMTNLAPLSDFAGGHCAIGFDLDLNHMAINRRGPLGLSEIDPWIAPFGGITGTNAWGAFGVNFEDLTSSVY